MTDLRNNGPFGLNGLTKAAAPDLSSVLCYVSAGEALPPDLFRRIFARARP